ncbi:MarR family transcriptional regulator [Hymenobacter lapidarius]|uniref:MarR family transcriptional regulator n=1 Tax=Hymenobacter lapidarius TaxID=1908237 RepID=A0A1G1TF89_9BACT|nr:GNAT family N-acetyltransferase [Hymenobacter lapidarius]OGX89534.1 MarR family transcriptional regulator [Hymenobacter lapidarius]
MNSDLLILDYEPAHQPAFRALNHEWIAHYFTIEPIDNEMLDDPEGYILAPGGHIFMASHGGAIVGTCALIKEHEGVYELAKMAVSPRAQGLGIGWALGQAVVAKARQLGARRVELLSNARLTPALALYAKLGFRHVPVPPTPYQRTDVKMVLDL